MTERKPIIGQIRGNQVFDGEQWIAIPRMIFKIVQHTVTGEDMVEVWLDGKFVAGIYPGSGQNIRHEPRPAIKVISKYFEDYCYYTDGGEPSAINLLLDPQQ
jgi:hypothetical protein